jgi:uncharacterized protein YjbI with pentapeptide repeats
MASTLLEQYVATSSMSIRSELHATDKPSSAVAMQDLSYTDLAGCNFHKCNFQNAKLCNARLIDNSGRRADFTGSDLQVLCAVRARPGNGATALCLTALQRVPCSRLISAALWHRSKSRTPRAFASRYGQSVRLCVLEESLLTGALETVLCCVC